MSRPPALIFVIRHGSRLDVADKKWHLTSPTPYDPPLSYGGWMQSKALGVKIGALIQQIDSESGAEIANSQPKQQKKQKNYNIVIHSSPYLRCVQTSIAISAGLAQTSTNKVSSSPATTGTSPSNSPPALVMPSPALKPTDKLQPGPEAAKTSRIRKTLLRLDAFLGEWLCPEYFELITPPPSSALMLAGAKAELLRREDFMTYPPVTTRHHSNSSSGKLWSSPLSSPADQLPDVDIPGGLETVPALNDALPDNLESPGARKNSGQKVRFVTNVTSSPIAATEGSAGYVAPTPHYAISHSGKIPEGYVYHAKDACVTVDYQWDSMRAPLEWGDGGSFGEEWASMHRRFRKGVQHLVDWYAATENPAEVTGRSRPSSTVEPGLMYEDGADNEVENVVIIVSHGAGCNAIIGAITHQPVLMEVGMASLTMAMRKPVKDMVFTTAAPAGDETDETASVVSNKGSVPVHHHYDLKIFANMEHIRPTSANSRHHTRPEVPQSASRGRMPNFSMSPTKPSPYTYTEGFNRNESRSNSANSALGSMRRSMVPPSWSLPRPPVVGPGGGTGGSGSFTGDHHAAHAPSPISTGLSRSPSIGLWSPATSRLNVSQEPDDDEDDMFPDFDHKKKFAPVRRNTKDSIGSAKSADLSGGKTAKSPAVAPIQIPSAIGAPTGEEADSANAVATPTSQPSSQPSSAGLWGSPQTTESPPVRDLSASKRRWTTNERS